MNKREDFSDKEKKLILKIKDLDKDFKIVKEKIKTQKGEDLYKMLYDDYKKIDFDKYLFRSRDSEGFKDINKLLKSTKNDLGRIRTETREKVVEGTEGEGEDKISLNLEDAFRMYLAKYQIVGFLEEYFKENEEPENSKKILNRNKERLIDYVFDNLPLDDIPKSINYYDKYPRPSNVGKQIEKKTGILKLTDEEAQELIERQDYSNIYEGKNPLGKATGNNKIKLLDHQRKFLNGFFLGNLRSAVVYHGVGTGKTLASAGSIKLYLQLYPKGNVIVITPPAVMFNFIDSLISFGINPQDRRISYYSFDRFSRNKNINTENSLIIIDEAHNLRTEIIGGFTEEEVEGLGNQYKYNLNEVVRGKRPASFIVKGFNANKIIMLTATPFVNTPYDIENLMAIGSSRVALGKSYFGEMVSGENFRYDYFKYRISKYDRNFESGDFPDMREKYIGIPAPKEGEKIIQAYAGKENPFYSVSRQAGLVIDKMKYCIDIIKKNPDKKFVIYSAYVFQGIKKIEKLLEENNIEYGFITGGMNVKTIGRYIDAYNNYNNPDYQIDKIRVLLISKAGAEGVNLLETRGIFVIDGVWNEALYEQIVARAVRYKSHKALPKNEQYVDVYKIFYCMEFELPFIKRLNDGKGFDYQKFFNAFQLLKKKKKNDEKILALSSGSNSSIINDATNKQLQEILSKSGNYDKEKLKKLKKGSNERKAYIEKNLTFGKDKAKYETQSILSNMKVPSTDFYMFVLQKIKENKINMFIKEIIKIPMVEKTVEDIPKSKKLLDMIKDAYNPERRLYKEKFNRITEKQVIENLVNGLIGKEDEINNILKKANRKGESDISKLINKSNELKALSTAKAKARVRQEFFTPDKIVKQILEIGGFNNLPKYSSLKVLEGSAGWGNIVRGILLMSMKKSLLYNVKIDMVEIQEDNRIELKKLMDEVPTAVNLMEEKNFLLFTPSKRYDFIFMNPPFFLQQKNNKEYKRDVFDYDFLLRAYAMLDLNGVLVFITGMKWKENKAIQNFYKEVEADITELKNVSWTGEEVKKGGEVSKLDISIIYIKKLVVNSQLDNSLLKNSLKLFVDFKEQLKPIPAPRRKKEKPIPAPRPKKPEPEPKSKKVPSYSDKQLENYKKRGRETLDKFKKGEMTDKQILSKRNINRVSNYYAGLDENLTSNQVETYNNLKDVYEDKVNELKKPIPAPRKK